MLHATALAVQFVLGGGATWSNRAVATRTQSIMSDLTGARKDTSKDDVHSDDSQETTFSSTSGKSNLISGHDASEVETEAETLADTNTLERRRYPYWPLFFIMAATAGER